jgi:hypothetical protein
MLGILDVVACHLDTQARRIYARGQMEEPAPAAPKQDGTASGQPPRKPRLHRVPSSVILAVCLALLSVWIAPAFTRQWDDRKDARALQENLAEQIVVSMDKLANGVVYPLQRDVTPDQRRDTFRRLSRDYEISATKIGAMFQIYFSPKFRGYWDQAVYSLETALEMYVDAYEPVDAGLRTNIRTSGKHALRDIHKFAESLDHVDAKLTTPFVIKGLLNRRTRVRVTTALDFLGYTRGLQFHLVDRLRGAHMDGFSTTRGDLLHDLLP